MQKEKTKSVKYAAKSPKAFNHVCAYMLICLICFMLLRWQTGDVRSQLIRLVIVLVNSTEPSGKKGQEFIIIPNSFYLSLPLFLPYYFLLSISVSTFFLCFTLSPSLFSYVAPCLIFFLCCQLRELNHYFWSMPKVVLDYVSFLYFFVFSFQFFVSSRHFFLSFAFDEIMIITEINIITIISVENYIFQGSQPFC